MNSNPLSGEANSLGEISVRDASTSYGDGLILSGISFAVAKGESLAIIGPSGSGKSTLLRCINLLQPLKTGELLFRGNRIAEGPNQFVNVDTFRRLVGMVHQELNLWPNKTVLQNLIEAPRFVLKMQRKEAIAKAEMWLARLALTGLANRFPSELSGGQRQRVAIARALMMESSVVMFDEITSGLDVDATEQLLRLLESLRDGTRTFIFVSHHLNFAERATDKTAVLINGQMEEIGPSRAVIRSPQNEKTQRFLSVVRATY